MKFSLFIVFAFLTLFASAQEEKEKEKTVSLSNSTVVKWNPTSLAFGKIGLLAEHNVKKNKSVTFAIGIPMEMKTRFKLDDVKREISMKTLSVMAGYRMYTGKKTMRGFYFEPYLKYLKNDAAVLIDGTVNSSPVVFSLTSEYSGVGVGAQLGVQFMIAKRVVFDIFFLGPEANSAHHTVTMHDLTSTGPWDSDAAKDAEKEINDNIGDLPIIGKKLKVTVDPNAKTVASDYKGFLPGLRGGISVGVRF
jgi:hypothetical protein